MDINIIISYIEKYPEIYEILKHCPYEILKLWEIHDYQAKNIVCYQADIHDYFYIIADGYADIFIMAENSKKYSQALYGRGNFIGELEIFDNQPYSCYVQALTDLKLLQLKREHFLYWFELDKNISLYITKKLCYLSYQLSQKAGEDTLYSLKTRLCNYLLSYTKNAKETSNIKIFVNKENLSDRFAVTLRSINRTLQELKSKNIIEIDNNILTIKNLKQLEEERKKSRLEIG